MPSSPMNATIRGTQISNDNSGFGQLEINVTSSIGFFPVKDAKIRISVTGESGQVVEELDINESGQSEVVRLPAPPVS